MGNCCDQNYSHFQKKFNIEEINTEEKMITDEQLRSMKERKSTKYSTLSIFIE